MDFPQQLPPGMVLGGQPSTGPDKTQMFRITAVEHTYKLASLFGYCPPTLKQWEHDVNELTKFFQNGTKIVSLSKFGLRSADGTYADPAQAGGYSGADKE